MKRFMIPMVAHCCDGKSMKGRDILSRPAFIFLFFGKLWRTINLSVGSARQKC